MRMVLFRIQIDDHEHVRPHLRSDFHLYPKAKPSYLKGRGKMQTRLHPTQARRDHVIFKTEERFKRQRKDANQSSPLS